MIDVALRGSRKGLVVTWEQLTVKQQKYVDWVAGAGTMVNDEGQIVTVTGEQLAGSLGVSRQALHKYRKLKGFWDVVADRRRELYGRERMNMLYKAVWAKGLKGDTQAAKLMMQQARVLEAERQDVTHSGVVGVAVVNYSDGPLIPPSEAVSAHAPYINEASTIPTNGEALREKGQLEQVPVPEPIRPPLQQSLPDSPLAEGAVTIVSAGLPLESSNPETTHAERLTTEPDPYHSPSAGAAVKEKKPLTKKQAARAVKKVSAARLLQAEASRLRSEQKEALRVQHRLLNQEKE